MEAAAKASERERSRSRGSRGVRRHRRHRSHRRSDRKSGRSGGGSGGYEQQQQQAFFGAAGGYPPAMPWGAAPGGMHYMGMVHPAVARSSMADDGVSMQVSEKFLMRNDYCQTFIDTGLRPQNFIRDLDYANRYSEYPKIERLIRLKQEILAKRATPGMSLKCDLKEFDLQSLGTKFDVILIDPPWEEYRARVMGMFVPNEDLTAWTLEELKRLEVGEIADAQSFCFLWCGEMHLEHGRELLKRWGFRRVEDICWVKTNRLAGTDAGGRVRQPTLMYGDTSVLQRVKEQCIVGVKGTLKRSVDTHFIHANCDVDLIMEEEKGFGSTEKPTELYETIEHFCLGRRRLELFGNDRNLRDGWLTLGSSLTTSNWNKQTYMGWFDGEKQWPEVKGFQGGRLLGSIPEIDALRPKSPVRSNNRAASPPRRVAQGAGGGAGSNEKDEEEEKPLPEDLGEMAPPLPKEDE